MTKSSRKKGSKPLSRKAMKKTVGGVVPMPTPMPIPMMKNTLVGLAPLPSPMPRPDATLAKVRPGARG